MAWHFVKCDEHKVYDRNCLATVVCQVKFHPILKISSGHGLDSFQEFLRSEFPEYSEVKSQIVNFVPPMNIEIQEQKQYQFRSSDGSRIITLGVDFVAVEHSRHLCYHDFVDSVDMVIKSLVSVYKPISTTRLGLRYVNVVDKNRISSDIGKDLSWDDLVSEQFLLAPVGCVSLDDTAFYSEIDSIMENGRLTLRYGLVREAPNQEVKYHFDMDRYLMGGFDVETTVRLVKEFALDSYSLFRLMASKSLLDWMMAEEGGEC